MLQGIMCVGQEKWLSVTFIFLILNEMQQQKSIFLKLEHAWQRLDEEKNIKFRCIFVYLSASLNIDQLQFYMMFRLTLSQNFINEKHFFFHLSQNLKLFSYFPIENWCHINVEVWSCLSLDSHRTWKYNIFYWCTLHSMSFSINQNDP